MGVNFKYTLYIFADNTALPFFTSSHTNDDVHVLSARCGMFRYQAAANCNGTDDDATQIALICVSVTLALVIIAVVVAVIGKRLAHARRNSGVKQEACTSPVVENGSMDEPTNRITMEQETAMQYPTVNQNTAFNQHVIDTTSKREARATAGQCDKRNATTQSAHDSQYTAYSVMNDGYETPKCC